jgi:hypothetical protein
VNDVGKCDLRVEIATLKADLRAAKEAVPLALSAEKAYSVAERALTAASTAHITSVISALIALIGVIVGIVAMLRH